MRDLLAAGGAVMGSSAGAMVLGGWTVLPDARPGGPRGPGLVPDVLVVPHWSGGRGDWLRAVDAGTPADTVVLGIPEESGMLVEDGTWTAVGQSPTRLVRPPAGTTTGRDLAVGERTTAQEYAREPHRGAVQRDAARGGRAVPHWPGREIGPVYVRSGPRDGGEPALLVHGLGGSSHNWTDLVALLAGRVEAEMVDLPGFGRSAPPADRSYRLGAHVRAVVGRIEARGAGPVHLFGNSLGGAVSTLVAAKRPDLVRTLTLVSPALPSLRPKRGSDPRLPLLLLPGLETLARRRLAGLTPEQRARGVLELCYGDPSPGHP